MKHNTLQIGLGVGLVALAILIAVGEPSAGGIIIGAVGGFLLAIALQHFLREKSTDTRVPVDQQKTESTTPKTESVRDALFLEMIISNIPNQVFIKDPQDDFRYKLVNKNFTDYYRIKHDEVVGHTDFEIFDPEVARQLRSHDKMVCAHIDRVFHFDEDISYHRKGNEVFKSLKLCFESPDHHPYLLGVCIDVTELTSARKNLEAALFKAQQAEKTKTLFLATMSHEIRTPLNAIVGLAELLHYSSLPPAEQTDYLRSIYAAGNSLLELINDVLDLSKLEAGQMHFTLTELNFAELLHDVQTIFLQKCAERNIALTADLPDDLPLLRLDKLRLRQILFNLIGNAVKFTEQGTITVKVRFQRETPQDGTLTFSVIDTGCGIAPEDQTRIFQMFEQAKENRRMRNHENGTGLGLPICRRLIEQMHGTIEVNSQLGSGSEFIVTLRQVSFTEPSVQTVPPVRPTEPYCCVSSLRVLLVDDIALNLKVLSSMLKMIGMEPLCADSAETALQILQEQPIDLVFTDLWMPGMNGCDFARKLRNDNRYRQLKIIAVTADTESASNFTMSLFDTVINKPLTLKQLTDTLNSLFHTH